MDTSALFARGSHTSGAPSWWHSDSSKSIISVLLCLLRLPITRFDIQEVHSGCKSLFEKSKIKRSWTSSKMWQTQWYQLENTQVDLTKYKDREFESLCQQAKTIERIKCDLMKALRPSPTELEKKLSELSITHSQKCQETKPYVKHTKHCRTHYGGDEGRDGDMKSLCEHL